MTIDRRGFIKGAGAFASVMAGQPASAAAAGDTPVIDVRDFGAVADGLDASAHLNDAAIDKALAAAPSHGTIAFPAGAGEYVVDAEHVIARPVTLLGTGGRLRLRTQSALFHDRANPWGRYLFHVRASDVVLSGMRLDGNSRGNYVDQGGVRYFLRSDAGNTAGVGLVLVGFYGTSVRPEELSNIAITHNTFVDAAGTCVDSLEQGGAHAIHGLRVTGNEFRFGQGVQVAFSHCANSICDGNVFLQPYFAAFQFYDSNVNCLFTGNMVYSRATELTLALVDPTLRTGDRLTYAGEVRVGKNEAHANRQCDVVGNSLYGGTIDIVSGTQFSRVEGNSVHAAQGVGISYQIAKGGPGNSIKHNKITACDQPGLYLADASDPVLVEGNELHGNCTMRLSRTYGGRELDANIVVFAPTSAGAEYALVRNFARAVAGVPKYGVVYSDAAGSRAPRMHDNDFAGSGADGDCITSAGNFPPVPAAGAPRFGDARDYSYAAGAFPADGTLGDALPRGVNGMALVSCGPESGVFGVHTAGGTTTVTKLSGTEHARPTDVAGAMCLFGVGDALRFRNRLGAAQAVQVQIFYRAG